MQIITIFKKEYRQQCVFALAMLLLCFLVQLAAFIGTQFTQKDIAPAFFGIALLMTALFAGAASAISFSGEHDDKTFGFLRSLPVTQMTVMLGKAGWLVCGTVAVFAASLLLSLFWSAIATRSFDSLVPSGAFGSVGVGIIEAFVWGLFWSPRCRSQIHAILATYSCASITGYIAGYVAAALVSPTSNDVTEFYCNAVWLRLVICAVVGVVAVFGMLKWFDRAIQKAGQHDLSATGSRGWFRYPTTPQLPFFAMLHHSIRQSSTILLCGIAVAFYLCCILFFDTLGYVMTDGKHWLVNNFFAVLSLVGCFFFYVIFCGSIFAQDQKNNSFRYLSRCGISARKIWWSRFLPFFTICFVAALFGTLFSIMTVPDFYYELLWMITCGVITFAIGTFLSISCRSMMVSIALTAGGSFFLFTWMLLCKTFCGFNSWWTTLPICVSLIIASRLRTADWIRERNTWKSRLIPLLPFFVTVIAIFIAIPLVRIYSVNNLSLAEIEAIVNANFTGVKTSENSHKIYLYEALSPEERKILFQKTAASLDKPFTEQEWREDDWLIHPSSISYKYRNQLANISSHRERVEKELSFTKEELAKIPVFEVWLLNRYAARYRSVRTACVPPDNMQLLTFYIKLYRYLPWEKARALRMLNDQLQFDYFKVNKSGDDLFYAYCPYYDATRWNSMPSVDRSGGLFDSNYWFWNDTIWEYPYGVSSLRISVVILALECWYLDHNNTLPDSLDELVGTYLEEIPVEPLTGKPMKYNPNPDDKNKPKEDNHKRGWAYIQLRERKCDLYFLPGYKEDKDSALGY
jgi:hypothetical protein